MSEQRQDGQQTKATSEEVEKNEEIPLEVLQLKYDALHKELDLQYASSEKEGKHNRKMFRLVLLLTGVLTTGLTYAASTELINQIWYNPSCAILGSQFCIKTNQLVYFGGLSLLISMLLYLVGASGGLLVGAPWDSAKPNMSDWTNHNSKKEYLRTSIDYLEYSLNENYKRHLSKKVAERTAVFLLLLSIIIIFILVFVLTTHSYLSWGLLLTGLVSFIFAALSIEIFSPNPTFPITPLKKMLIDREE